MSQTYSEDGFVAVLDDRCANTKIFCAFWSTRSWRNNDIVKRDGLNFFPMDGIVFENYWRFIVYDSNIVRKNMGIRIVIVDDQSFHVGIMTFNDDRSEEKKEVC